MNFDRIYILPQINKIQFSFSLIGIFFYISLIILFFFYYNCLFFIKEGIFSFILIKSLVSFIEVFIESDIFRTIFLYISQVILFFLLLIHLNKCLIQRKIVEDIKDLEINDKKYILLIYIICFFPFELCFDFQLIENLCHIILKIILCVLLYGQIDKRIKLMMEKLNEKQIKAKGDLNYVLGQRENYYLKMLKTIDSMILFGFILFILYYSLNICLISNNNEFIKFISELANDAAIASICLSQLLFFFCSNKIELERGLRKSRLNGKLKKFVIIKIFNQGNQEDVDENYNLE